LALVFVGDGAELYKDKIQAALKTKAKFMAEKFWRPKAEHLFTLAYPQFLKKEYNDIDSLVPLYLYPEDCQVAR
jgi:hypothetical protein